MPTLSKLARTVKMVAAPAVAAAVLTSTVLATSSANAELPEAGIRDQVIYFVMPDRFNNGNPENDYGDKSPEDDVLVHGHDTTDRAMYHGGDIQGLTEKLDYIEKLGATTIWTTPVMVNKTVQYEGSAGWISGSHGFWVTDFMNVEPHLGTNDEFASYVDAAHDRGIKVVLDILANHTADVFGYEECNGGGCSYVEQSVTPYVDADGNIFDPVDHQYSFTTGQPFPTLNAASFPYTPVTSDEEANIKNPAWLNDPQYYHNRGNSGAGESSLYGDFARLDDLFTEHPVVVQGLVDIYAHWINTYGIDGYRLDAARHVETAFWAQWHPKIRDVFQAHGKDDYMMFGEVFDPNPAAMSKFTSEATLPQVLDFGFQAAAESVFSKRAATSTLQNMFEGDDYFIDPDTSAYYFPTFLGNHDMGRIGAFLMRDNPTASADELLARTRLAHALMFTVRGIPTVYYGDEQGFTGLFGGNTWFESARQDMFASQTPEYMAPEYNQQIGASTTPSSDNFDKHHPLYEEIREFANLRKQVDELRQGAQVHRYADETPGGGIYAFSRIGVEKRKEIVVIFNTSTEEKTATFDTFYSVETNFEVRYGDVNFSDIDSDATGALTVSVPALDFVVLKADDKLPARALAPAVNIAAPTTDFGFGQFWVEADLDEDTFANVAFYVRVAGEAEFTYLGTDDNAPYRVNYDGDQHELGTVVEFKAVVTDYSGNSQTSSLKNVTIENRLQDVTVVYENGNNQAEFMVALPNGTFGSPLAVDDSGYTFTWPAGTTELSIFFGTESNGILSYDLPVTLSLVDDVIPNANLVAGGLEAVLYVNNAHEIDNANNFGAGDVPVMFPNDMAAANPLSHSVYIRGTLNGWGVVDELIYQSAYNFSDQVTFETPGLYKFKFADADWTLFNYGTGFNPATGMNGSGAFNDINVTIPEGEAGVYDAHMFAFPDLSGGVNPYVFYRLKRDKGPLGDLFLQLDGGENQKLVYLGEGYELSSEFSVGTYQVTVVDEASNVVASYALEVSSAGVFKTTVDATDPANPVVMTVSSINHGPFGAMYLRGGSAITGVADWAADDSNLFTYDESAETLSLNAIRLSTSMEQGDWAFKIADANWAVQFGGQSGEWLHPDNQIVFGVPYALAGGEPLFVLPGVGEYDFSIDVSDEANPMLTVNYTNHGPFGPVFVRGGAGITNVADWAAVDANLFAYDEAAATLTARIATESASVEQGDWAFKLASADWSFQQGGQSGTWLDPENELTLGVAYPLGSGEPVFVAPAPGVYTMVVDVTDPVNPMITVTLEEFGPYGAMYVRGGSAITGVSDWATASANAFAFDAVSNTLNLIIQVDSTSASQGDWAFKLATADWGTQFTGQANAWLDPANEVISGVDYVMGIAQEPLFVAPAAGEYHLSVDLADAANPVLSLTLNP